MRAWDEIAGVSVRCGGEGESSGGLRADVFVTPHPLCLTRVVLTCAYPCIHLSHCMLFLSRTPIQRFTSPLPSPAVLNACWVFSEQGRSDQMRSDPRSSLKPYSNTSFLSLHTSNSSSSRLSKPDPRSAYQPKNHPPPSRVSYIGPSSSSSFSSLIS